MADILVLSDLLSKVEKDSRKNVKRICFGQKDNTIKIKDINNKEIKKFDLPQILRLHIDGIDGDVFLNLEVVEFQGCKFDKVRFENYKDESQNVFLNADSSKDFDSLSSIKNPKYPLLKFDNCKFENIEVENAKLSSENFKIDKAFKIDSIKKQFHYKLKLNKCEFLRSIELDHIDFHENIEINASTFKEQVKFFNTKFEGEFTVFGINKETIFEKDFILLIAVFEKKVKIENTVFKGDKKSLDLVDVDFKDSFILDQNVKFERKVEFSGKFNEVAFSGVFEESLSLTKCKFEKNLQFVKAVFNGGFVFNWSSSKEKKEFNQKITFKKVEFNKHFSMYKCLFKEKVCFEDVNFKEKLKFNETEFKQKVEFKNITFEKEFEISKDTFTQDELIFEKVNFNLFKCDDKEFFKKELKFKNCEFQQIHEFKDLTFNKISFNTCRFNDNVYFNNAIFKDYADFHESQFEKVAGFYGASFDKVPNFSACVFKELSAVNLIGVDIDEINFDAIRVYIDKCHGIDKTFNDKKGAYNNDDKKVKQLELEFKIKYAQNAKDSFRVLKNVLIEQNNLLEAQNWHKLELYAKEIEIETKLEKYDNSILKKYDGIVKETVKEVKYCKKYYKFNFIDFVWRLVKIILKLSSTALAWMIAMATLVLPLIIVFLLICVEYSVMKIIKALTFILKSLMPLSIDKFVIFWKGYFRICTFKISKLGKNMRDFTLFFDKILLQIYRNTSDHHTNFIKILNFTTMIIAIYWLANFLLSYYMNFLTKIDQDYLISALFISFSLPILFIIQNIKKVTTEYFFIILFLFLAFFMVLATIILISNILVNIVIVTYILMICIFYGLFIIKVNIIVFIVRLFAYMGIFMVITTKPQLINPLFGIFQTENLVQSKFEKQLNEFSPQVLLELAQFLQNSSNINLLPQDKNASFEELNAFKHFIKDSKDKLKPKVEEDKNDKAKNDKKEGYIAGFNELQEAIHYDEMMENIIRSTSVLYSIILLLCLYSLAKTARKNSIVPS
ncbi:hypothetical protein CQA38_06015 [Campylobacter sp. MIT 12-5580]|uniref:pentapeptide repeat-containing protein n=1 Tax=Campylobacter sp. MIT 12-5580 TaxID=2040651 RepID=UPI0010F9B2B6|nr:pentapeptide repeat-containing protein [Campylobacter sp. MIT 12-5580]TKX28707.1 hypothetical protein CQA38_06015 [Campylobacter sp. MIT 12-5580]